MNLKNIYILLCVMTFSTSGFSKSIICPIGMIKATTDVDDQTKTGDNQTLTLTPNQYSEFEGSAQFTSPLNQKAEVYVTFYQDQKIPSLFQANVVTKIDGQRVSGQSFLIRNNGPGKEGGWDMGSAGADQLAMMAPNSLESKSLDLRLTGNAFSVLKNYELYSPQENRNTYYVLEAAAKAIQDGKLQEGSYIGTMFIFGCYMEN